MTLFRLLDALPTRRWRELGVVDFDHDDAFEQIEGALVEFLGALAKAASDDARLEAVRACVEALNHVNDAFGGGIIETGEREDLVRFIGAAATAAGLHVQGDPTLRWRAW